ncbi:hypothetical protein JL720_7463 [Aureococcus anophagefferens]|nr:hypothetical protein JL720_7463 [Aureococcus anophagefferens]
MGTARVAIALVVCLLGHTTALTRNSSVAAAGDPILDASLQSRLYARYGSLAAAGAAAEGVGVWRGPEDHALLGTAASSGAGRFQPRGGLRGHAALRGPRGRREELRRPRRRRRATAASGAAGYGSDARRSRDGARGACVREAPPATEGFDGDLASARLAPEPRPARRGLVAGAAAATASTRGAGSPLRRSATASTFLADHDDLALLMGASARPPPSSTALAAAALAPAGALAPAPRFAAADADAAAVEAAPPAFPWRPRTRGCGAPRAGLVERSGGAARVAGAAGREHAARARRASPKPPVPAPRRALRRAVFEIALTRFTTPDDVFGPTGRAAGPAWQVRRRRWANTPGGDDDDDDDALYDRFLIRREVAPVSDAAVADLLLGDDVDGRPRAALSRRCSGREPPALEAWLLDRVVPDDALTLATLLAALSGGGGGRSFGGRRREPGAVRDAEAGVAGGQLFLAPDALLAARQALAPSPRAALPPQPPADLALRAEGRELPDDDDGARRRAEGRAARAGDDDDFDLTMSKKKAKKELTAAEFGDGRGARGPEG